MSWLTVAANEIRVYRSRLDCIVALGHAVVTLLLLLKPVICTVNYRAKTARKTLFWDARNGVVTYGISVGAGSPGRKRPIKEIIRTHKLCTHNIGHFCMIRRIME